MTYTCSMLFFLGVKGSVMKGKCPLHFVPLTGEPDILPYEEPERTASPPPARLQSSCLRVRVFALALATLALVVLGIFLTSFEPSWTTVNSLKRAGAGWRPPERGAGAGRWSEALELGAPALLHADDERPLRPPSAAASSVGSFRLGLPHAPPHPIPPPSYPIPYFGAAGSRPHIVFVLVDDWGHELWPRSNNAGAARLLPVLRRRLVDEGLTLARHYAYMFCAPSRQSLLSGRWPMNVNQQNSNCLGIPLNFATLADQMSKGGCDTGGIQTHAAISLQT